MLSARGAAFEGDMATTLTDDLYAKLVNEEDARVCREIPDAACREVPKNFFLLVGSYVLTKLGDSLANPKTTLTWMMDAIGAPVALTGLLVPIRETGSLIPQLVIAAFVRRQPIRKWVWVIGSLLQAFAVMAMGLIAWCLSGVAAGVAVIASLTVFSLARGLSSVAAKDVIGKTIPKTRRGRVNGFSASVAGLATLGVGAALVAVGVDDGAPATFLALLTGAATLWVAAAGLYSRIGEWRGETEGGGNALADGTQNLRRRPRSRQPAHRLRSRQQHGHWDRAADPWRHGGFGAGDIGPHRDPRPVHARPRRRRDELVSARGHVTRSNLDGVTPDLLPAGEPAMA